MMRSKLRSEGVERNNHSLLVFARTLSGSKFCRGDSVGRQIDSQALIKSGHRKLFKNSNSNSSEDREMEEELRRKKERLHEAELDKERVAKELREAVSEKDRRIAALETKLGELGKLEVLVANKDGEIDGLKNEAKELRGREDKLTTALSENKRRIQELEAEVDKRRQLESRMKELEVEVEKRRQAESTVAAAFAAKSREFDSVEFELQESKIEMTSLHEKIELLESLYNHDNGVGDVHNLENEMKLAQPAGEKELLSRVQSLEGEVERLRREWRRAVEGEERSVKAMEDLAVALQEVALEGKEAREKVSTMEAEIERLKAALITTEHLLNEAQHEAEMHKNEAEEMLMAWNGKEMGFVSCIKQAEVEKEAALHESNRLAESLKAVEIMMQTAREEAYKSRDLLKQAVNEANVAKAAVELAREENSQLQDSLAEKEEELHYLMKENQRFRINEATAQDTIKQLKSMLSASTTTGTMMKTDDKNKNETRTPDSSDSSSVEDGEGRNMREALIFNPEELGFLDEPRNLHLKVFDEDPAKAEALKGSIFDMTAVTPKSESHTPKHTLGKQRRSRRRYSFSYTEVSDDIQNSEAYYHSELDETSSAEKNPNPEHSHQRVKTMFRRVGWPILAIGRAAYHRRVPSSIE